MAAKDDLYREGRKLLDEKQFEPALAKLAESAKLEAAFMLPLHAMVQCLTELGRHEAAIATAQQIVAAEPDDQFAYIALSRAYQRAGMIPEAEMAMMQGHEALARSQMGRK